MNHGKLAVDCPQQVKKEEVPKGAGAGNKLDNERVTGTAKQAKSKPRHRHICA